MRLPARTYYKQTKYLVKGRSNETLKSFKRIHSLDKCNIWLLLASTATRGRILQEESQETFIGRYEILSKSKFWRSYKKSQKMALKGTK
jgi:hypothetical protein